MKLLTNKKYNEFINSSNVYKEMYNNETTKLMLANKDYELQIEEILNRLKEMVSKTNEKMGKAKYKEKIKDLIIFIQGKQR